jgi:TRAP-type transport system periplasmic protein
MIPVLRHLLLFACALAAIAPANAKPVRVKLATLAPKGTSFHQIMLKMGETWKAAPDGGVQLTIFTDGTMGAEGDMVRRIRLGQLQAGLLTASGLTDIEAEIAGLQNIPMAFRSLDEAAFVRDRLAPRFEKQTEEKGFIMLGWCDTGWWRVFSKKPLRVPDDMRGEKILVGLNGGEMGKVVRALGMQPVELSPTDILVSLQTGMITVTPSPPIYALNGQFFQPAPNMLELNWAPLVGGIALSKKAWDDMTPAQRDVVRTSAAAACAEITMTGRREMTESIAAMEKRGLNVQRLEGELEKQWIAVFEGIQPQARGGMVPDKTYDEIMVLVQEYRSGAGAAATAVQPETMAQPEAAATASPPATEPAAMPATTPST